MRILNYTIQKVQKQMHAIDHASLQADVEFPEEVIINQAVQIDGNQETKAKTYYSEEAWQKIYAQKDRDRADQIEILHLPFGTKQRWFWSYVVKSLAQGLGWYLLKVHQRFDHTKFSNIPLHLEKDRDVLITLLNQENQKAYAQGGNAIYDKCMFGFVYAFYDFLAVDNAYAQLYENFKKTLNKNSSSKKVGDKT